MVEKLVKSYSFGVPKVAIWTTHILTGLYFLYLGSLILNKYQLHAIILIVFGVLMILYHGHLWFYNLKYNTK